MLVCLTPDSSITLPSYVEAYAPVIVRSLRGQGSILILWYIDFFQTIPRKTFKNQEATVSPVFPSISRSKPFAISRAYIPCGQMTAAPFGVGTVPNSHLRSGLGGVPASSSMSQLVGGRGGDEKRDGLEGGEESPA